MKKIQYFLFAVILTQMLSAEDRGFDFLTASEWFIDSEIYARDAQQAFFRKNGLPPETSFYRQQVALKTFFCYYPVGIDHMVMIGWDYNKDGKDDILDIATRESYSKFWIVQPGDLYFILTGGTRKGIIQYSMHPFVGIWNFVGGDFASEVRLVKPADYQYFMKLTEIRGYGIRDGWYLLKYLGNNIFESDDTFEDGHVRLEVKNEKELILTPLFTLPKGEGFVAPVKLRARG